MSGIDAGVAPARPGEVVVGVVANPMSGHDIRRLVARASVFPTNEKTAMVLRLLAALAATGVHRVMSMIDSGGVAGGVWRAVEGHRPGREPPFPPVDFLEAPLTGGPQDSIRAVTEMVRLGVRVIVVLGGDGTNRVVAGVCGDVPLVSLSTGTNNAFARLGEATVAGLAAGLVAGGRVPHAEACRRNKVLVVEHGDRRELGLVDVSVTSHDGVGARAVWDVDHVSEVFVAFAEPHAIGLSAIAGLVRPVSRDDAFGLRVAVTPGAATRVLAPIAPGLVQQVGIAHVDRLEPGVTWTVEAAAGVIAIDGERELEFGRGARPTVTLSLAGPLSVEIRQTMAVAAARGLLVR